MSLLTQTAQILAGVPNPAPVDPTDGAKGIGLLISYIKWGVLLICALCAVGSFGYMAAGRLQNRPDAAERGKTAFVWSVVATVGVALAIPLINNVFDAAD
jgi:ABC-type Mn2+/Zn2+ transport system permease subunit